MATLTASLAQTLTCTVAYEPSFAWWFPAAGLIGVGAGLGFAVFANGWKRVLGAGMSVFSALWVITAGIGIYGDYATARAAATSAATPVVEGPVENFDPAPPEGHKDESFTVAGVPFAYSDYVITGGFNTSASHGGPIRAGRLVRIRYLPTPGPHQQNLIVQVEVCQ